jgi:hypothetical protein
MVSIQESFVIKSRYDGTGTLFAFSLVEMTPFVSKTTTVHCAQEETGREGGNLCCVIVLFISRQKHLH